MDERANFAISELTSGIASGDTSLTLSDASNFPTPTVGYSAVLWDSGLYGNPADDPNVEVIRTTGKSTNTLTILRAQEGTSDVDHNTSGHTYSLAASLTKKTIDDLESLIDNLTASDISLTDTADYYVATDAEVAFAELREGTYKNGFLLGSPNSMGDLAWDDATRTFSISVHSGESEFYFWANRKKITKTTTQSVVIPDTTGGYYIYFDNDGVLQYIAEDSVDLAEFYDYALVGLVYWNATAGTGIASNERHGVTMSPATHLYNHKTFGARYDDGLDIEGLTDGGTTYTQTTSGHFWDEDIEHALDAQSTHPFLYRLGASGEWTTSTADNNVCFKNGGSYGVWNEWTGSTWQLTQGTTSTDFVIYFYVAFPGLSTGKIYKLIGQNAYATRTAARNAIETEMNSISLEGLISPEFIFLYATIVKRDGTLSALADGSTYFDLRYTRGSGGASLPATYAADVNTDASSFSGILSSTDTDVQTALETLSSEALASLLEDTSPQLGGELDAQAHSIGFTEQAITSSSGSATIDWRNSNKAAITLTENTTLTFTAPTKPCNLVLRLVQDSTGGWTITLPTIKYPSGTAPTFSTAANAIDVLSLYFDGTNYYGQASLDFS